MNTFNYQQSIENHFPITVLERQFSQVEKLHKGLVSLIESIEEKDRNTDRNAVRSGKITTSGGFQTSLEMNLFDLKNIYLDELKQHIILPAITEYLKIVFGDEAQKIIPELIGWSNILQAGDWQRPHMHPSYNNLVSGSYYIQIPAVKDSEEGRIEFINPIPISVHHGYSNSRRINPKEGKLLLFPPYYNHFVHPLKSKGKRIMLAFDVIAKSQKNQLVF